MRNTNYLRKALPLIFILFAWKIIEAQEQISFRPAVNTMSGIEKWKPIVLPDLSKLQIAAPPGHAQTVKELVEVKKKMSEANEKIMADIRYWDAGSPAYRWNEIACSMVTLTDPTFFRFPVSWMNMAIYDATLAAWKAKYNYNRKRPFETDASIMPVVMAPATPSYPCEHTVTAAAAATVLAYFYPKNADSIISLAKQASQSRIYAGLQYPSDVEAAWKLGEQVANKIIAQAKKDGADIPYKGQMPKDAKLWQGDYPVGINVKNYKPIILKSGDQFRPPAPPNFANDMKEMQEFKQDFNSTYLALRWASLSGLEFWTELASKKIFEERLEHNTPQCARIYALLHTALYDAGIAIMDAKYAYWGIRPFQYDKNYKPLIDTPPFPGYPSGHAAASSTAATVLSYFFPADKAFFRSKAEECAKSRFYGGIHFRTDNETGLDLGEKLATHIISIWMMRDDTVKK